MALNIEQWIETVRMKPEHIRRRYVLACVAVSMSVVAVLWLFSVGETFRTLSQGAGDVATDVTTILPKPPGDYSLNDVTSGKRNLGDGKSSRPDGNEFLQENFDGKMSPTISDEGIAPKEQPTDTVPQP